MEYFYERRTVDVLHRNQLLAVELHEIENPADVGRDHFTSCADFLSQSGERLLFLYELGTRDLERDIDAKLQVISPPHFTHTATTEQRTDLETTAGDLTWGNRFVWELARRKRFGIVSDIDFNRRLFKGKLKGAAGAKLRSPRLLGEPCSAVETMRGFYHCLRFLQR
jgi:hypothetical protein